MEYLLKLGVEVRIGIRVIDYFHSTVILSDGEKIPSNTVIWAAGIKGNKIPGLPDFVWNSFDRIKVDEFNAVIGLSDVFALGDICLMESKEYPLGHPQVAQVAIQQADCLAGNLLRKDKNNKLKSFQYKNLGSMATIGRHLAVVDLPFIKLKGIIAWYIWMFIHLMAILGVRNKLVVFINWIWSYFTFDQSLRLIIHRKTNKNAL